MIFLQKSLDFFILFFVHKMKKRSVSPCGALRFLLKYRPLDDAAAQTAAAAV